MLFITIEDETGVANLVVWPGLFERRRRLVLSATMLAARGRVQREGEVVHLVAEGLIDLSDLLRAVGGRGGTVDGRPDGGPGLDPDRGIKVPTRDFR